MSAELRTCGICAAAAAGLQPTGYGLDACPECWRAAAPGWPAAAEPALMRALAASGRFIPDRNPTGRLPREYAPPADFPI